MARNWGAALAELTTELALRVRNGVPGLLAAPPIAVTTRELDADRSDLQGTSLNLSLLRIERTDYRDGSSPKIGMSMTAFWLLSVHPSASDGDTVSHAAFGAAVEVLEGRASVSVGSASGRLKHVGLSQADAAGVWTSALTPRRLSTVFSVSILIEFDAPSIVTTPSPLARFALADDAALIVSVAVERNGGTTALIGDRDAARRVAEAIAESRGAHLRVIDTARSGLLSTRSKSIGETEKDLRRLFAAASESGDVLLFDEADALFGRRTGVRDAHDRYADLMNAYPGCTVLLSTRRAGSGWLPEPDRVQL